MERERMLAQYRAIPAALRVPLLVSLFLLLLFAAGLTLPNVSIFDSPEHYLPIHTLIEALSAVVSAMVFITGWRLYGSREAGSLPLLGGAFLAVALIDAMHALSYPGMPAFITPNSPEKAIDFWLAGRFIAIGSLLAMALLTKRELQLHPRTVWASPLAGLLISLAVLYIVIAHGTALPHTFIAGTGLTPFKITAEYLLIVIGLAAALAFVRLAASNRTLSHGWLAVAALAFAMGEFFFSRYGTVTDLMNLLGHAFKAFGCLAIYFALIARQEHQPWWKLAPRIRLFIAILLGAFAAEYLVMISLPFLIPAESSRVFEAVVDASTMAVLASAVILLAINRFQSRAMRAEYVLEHSHDGYCVIDEQGYLIDANASFCRMFGYRLKTLLTFNITAFEVGWLAASNRIDISRIIDEGYSNHLTQFQDRDGNIIDLDISATHLPAAHSIVLFLQDVTAVKHFKQLIDNLAYYDQLTQLPNRQLLLEHLEAAQANSGRNRAYGALLAFNIDDFKQLNHAHGTEIGDEFLIVTAKQLSSHAGESNVVARLSGDEFIVVLEGVGETTDEAQTNSRQMAVKLRAAIGTPVRLGHQGELPYQGSASVGITLFLNHAETAEVLLRQAIIAVHQAKSAHRNAIRFYSGEVQQIASERIELTEALHRAIDDGQFLLHYQPQVDRHGHIIGAEALLRWQHPTKGFISPGRFIPLAEETGLILPLGRQVLHSACHQLKQWQDEFDLPDFTLSVNVSATQFRDRGFAAQIKEELARSGVAPDMLKLELTEGMLIENVHLTIRHMKELTGLGIRFSMDDFGTGYSSLSYLTTLPLAELKIDRSFVSHIDSNPDHVAVIKTIINMGRTLNLHIIAEGVETEAELVILEENGCHAHQGYLFSKPLPAEAFTELLKAGKTDWPASDS